MNHVDLLLYLGKQISFTIPSEYNPNGYDTVNGQVISVCIELDGHHQLCVDAGESTEVYCYDEMNIKKIT